MNVLLIGSDDAERNFLSRLLRSDLISPIEMVEVSTFDDAISLLCTVRFDIVITLYHAESGSLLSLPARYKKSMEVPPVIVVTRGELDDLDLSGPLSKAAGVITTDGLTSNILAMSIKCALDKAKHLRATLRREMLFRREALTDKLTQLGNRRHFDETCATLFSSRPSTGFGFVFVDIDDFKQINDCFGHSIGDDVLSEVGNRLSNFINAKTDAFRIGGDEFCIVSKADGNISYLDELSKEVRSAFEKCILTTGSPVETSVSTGVGSYPMDGKTLKSVRVASDKRLKKSKAEKTKRAKVKKLSQDMPLGIRKQDEVTLWIQPIFSCKTGRICHFEALARLHNPLGKILLPNEFLHKLSDKKSRLDFTLKVVRAACEQIQCLRNDFDCSLPIFMNAEADILEEETFFPAFCDVLGEFDVSPKDLGIEIIETTQFSDMTLARQRLDRFKEAGCSLALDDFCQGHSNLEWLTRLPIDCLKIDRKFVSRLPRCDRSRATFEFLASLCREIGVTMIAEGVESPDQIMFMRRVGCNAMQGFALEEPLPFTRILRRYFPDTYHKSGVAFPNVVTTS
jgi:diguanylate cyclase (GGDEF)-like protein